MKIPIVRPTKFTVEAEEILKKLSKEVNSDTVKKAFVRLHKDNMFNKRFSGVLDAFSDLKSVTERMERNIEHSVNVERQIQQNKDVSQETHIEADKLLAQNKTDLKTLYVNSKIFLDEYTSLLKFIFDWWGIGDKSVTSFYNSLDKYDGNDEEILVFKEKCLKKLKAIDIYITEYRDREVVHNQQKHKAGTRWFLNNMNGEIRFIGGNRASLTPQEVLFIVVQYIDCTVSFCIERLIANT